MHHLAAEKRLRGNKPVRVCLEAAESYRLDAAIARVAVANAHHMVVNPKVSKRFAEALMRRPRTDKVDAEMLATYAARMDFVARDPFIGFRCAQPNLRVCRAIALRLAAARLLLARMFCELRTSSLVP